MHSLRFTWHGQLRGGYGWVFPGPDDTFNIGVAADATVQSHDEACLRSLLPRYRSFQQAGGFNLYPWLADLVIWRTQRSPRIQAKLADVLNERRLPPALARAAA